MTAIHWSALHSKATLPPSASGSNMPVFDSINVEFSTVLLHVVAFSTLAHWTFHTVDAVLLVQGFYKKDPFLFFHNLLTL